MDVAAKTCSRCAESKPLDAFYVQTGAASGRQSRCRECTNKASREYRAANVERLSEYNRRWRAENAELADELTRDWRNRNRERVAVTKQAWAQNHLEHRREQYRIWSAENVESKRAGIAQWKEANPERVSGHHRKRRATVRGAVIGVIDGEAMWKAQDSRCPLCLDLIDRTLSWPDPASISLDHNIPLSRGGEHTQSNVQWTHLLCNLRKGDRLS